MRWGFRGKMNLAGGRRGVNEDFFVVALLAFFPVAAQDLCQYSSKVKKIMNSKNIKLGKAI